MRRLEIGGGPSPTHPDWEQLDLNDWSEQGNPTTHLCDMRDLSCFDEGTFDAIYAQNVLEHVRETYETLLEWAHVLKPGGTLEIIVPEVLGIIADYLEGKDDWQTCSERLYGAQGYPEDIHRAGFTMREMPAFIEAAGLEIVALERSHEGSGIYVRARRPL